MSYFIRDMNKYTDILIAYKEETKCSLYIQFVLNPNSINHFYMNKQDSQ